VLTLLALTLVGHLTIVRCLRCGYGSRLVKVCGVTPWVQIRLDVVLDVRKILFFLVVLGRFLAREAVGGNLLLVLPVTRLLGRWDGFRIVALAERVITLLKFL
jgi:hypothetical protein